MFVAAVVELVVVVIVTTVAVVVNNVDYLNLLLRYVYFLKLSVVEMNLVMDLKN
jgi:hypothetical protein